MKIYHGTNIEFGAIDLDLCPPDRDFGQGFYCTNIKKHAERRAEGKTYKEGGKITVLEYDFDLNEIKNLNPDLKIKYFEDVSAEWAQFVMYNRLRKENEPKHDYDIVEGPVADDKMFRQFQLFANNQIRLKEFVGSLKFPAEDTHQIVFCTEKAISALLDYNLPARYKIEKQISELSLALMQDLDISEIDAMRLVYSSKTFGKLADETTEFYKKSWQEIYDLLKQELSINSM